MPRTFEPPQLLVDAAREGLDALEQDVNDQLWSLQNRHTEVFADFRRRLEALFYSYSLLPIPEETEPGAEPVAPVPQWDSVKVRQANLQSDLKQLFADLMVALGQEDQQQFADALDAAADDGFDRSLWQLSLAGLDIDPYTNEGPDDWADLLLSNDVNGQNWAQRLAAWGAVTTDKGSRWMQASMLGGSSLSDTLDGLSRIALGHTQRVAGLFGNEAFRAFVFAGGMAVALAAADTEMQEVWVTRQDAKVCPICAAKHLTVTTERPVDDSHPGCRCIKVQVPADYVPTPQSFESFRGRQ